MGRRSAAARLRRTFLVCVSAFLGIAALAASPEGARPNLTPQSPSTAPLLRKINLKPATMIPAFYCSRVPVNQETDVDVPPFDWGVANDDQADVREAFTVSLLADARAQIATQPVQQIPRAGTRIFRNWPGRPTHVTVIKVTSAHERFAAEYDSTPGCYIPTALVGKVTLDPRVLTVRVDDGGRITERVESDNDLSR
jgi:hypothetical protein